jgi:hypothetical protein
MSLRVPAKACVRVSSVARRGLLALALAVGVTVVPATVAWPQAPNIVVVQGDDWGWPYYGFMQRYIAARIAGVCSGGSNPGAPCNANAQCIDGVCASDLVGDDPQHRGKEYKDPQLLGSSSPSIPVRGARPSIASSRRRSTGSPSMGTTGR